MGAGLDLQGFEMEGCGMKNAILDGDWPEEKTVGSMVAGEVGYVVPWVFDAKAERLDEKATVSSGPGGTATLRVQCVRPGRYIVKWGG